MSSIDATVWLFVIYFLPSVVAFARKSGWRSLAFFVNIVFGWTVVGWFIAWFLAFHKAEQVSRHPEFWQRREGF